jgi:hypothetical protein
VLIPHKLTWYRKILITLISMERRVPRRSRGMKGLGPNQKPSKLQRRQLDMSGAGSGTQNSYATTNQIWTLPSQLELVRMLSNLLDESSQWRCITLVEAVPSESSRNHFVQHQKRATSSEDWVNRGLCCYSGELEGQFKLPSQILKQS